MHMRLLLMAICMAAVSMANSARAELKTYGRFESMMVDTSTFPPKMKEAYSLYMVKCSKCHRLDRSLNAIKTGITPSGVEFNEASVDAYANKMLRKPDSQMTKQDIKTVSEVLRYMIREASK